MVGAKKADEFLFVHQVLMGAKRVGLKIKLSTAGWERDAGVRQDA